LSDSEKARDDDRSSREAIDDHDATVPRYGLVRCGGEGLRPAAHWQQDLA
jgi:hypothetical protein